MGERWLFRVPKGADRLRARLVSKGSGRRPIEVPEEVYKTNWERTFGPKKRAKYEPPPPLPEPPKGAFQTWVDENVEG